MRDELVAVEVEIDPVVGASPLWTAHHAAIEGTRRSKVIDRKGEVKEWLHRSKLEDARRCSNALLKPTQAFLNPVLTGLPLGPGPASGLFGGGQIIALKG